MAKEAAYRLSNSTVAEPLINRWAAWAHVISPVAASLHLQNYQIKMLNSYLSDPKIHEEACQKPKLRSGAFMNIKRERAPEVKELLARTEAEMKDNLELAKSTVEFQNFLAREGKGQSLEPFYANLPSTLRGLVELVYDYYNHPILRFFEGLTYKSPYYKSHLQSLHLFKQSHDGERLFFQNTPHLPEPDQIDWNIPFESPQVDEFFKLDYTHRSLGEIRELLGLQPSDDARLLPLLTEDPIPPTEKWEGPAVRMRTLGHAGILVEWNGTSILVDPYVSPIPSEGGLERMSYHDLPEKIDYVLTTHLHQDHFCLETLLRLRHKIGCLVVPKASGIFYGDISLKIMARTLGFKHVMEMEALESIGFPGGEIIGIPFLGEHADLPHGKTGYLVRAGKEQIFFGADSDCLDSGMYERLRRLLGPIETVFIGMECVGAPLSWACGPFLPIKTDYKYEQTRRYKGCDSMRAQSILEAVGAKRVYIYAMGLEPWMEHLLGLAYTEDAKQIKEAKKLVSTGQAKGFDDAELLFGKREILLSDQPLMNSPPCTDVVSGPPIGDHSTDQFAFD